MRIILFFVFMLIFSGQVYSADYYVCNTAENTGNDANDGSLANPWLTMDKALSEADNLNGFDTISFCEGFDDTSTTENIIASTGSCDKATPCIIKSYRPAGTDPSDEDVKPKLTNITYDVIKFDGGVLEDGGYDLVGFHLVGGASTNCISIMDGFSDVLISNPTFENCDIGVYTEVVAGEISTGVVVSDAEVNNVVSLGYSGSSSYGGLYNSTFQNVGSGAGDHAAYIYGLNTIYFEMTGNTFTDTAHDTGICSSSIVEVNGSFRGLYTDDNHYKETEGNAGAACIGLLMRDNTADDAIFNQVYVGNSVFEYVGTNGFACQNCVNIKVAYNIIIGDDALSEGILIPYGSESGAISNRVEINQNTILMKDADTNRTAIKLDVAQAELMNTTVIKNDDDDVCWEVNAGHVLAGNTCLEAVVGGLEDSTNVVVN